MKVILQDNLQRKNVKDKILAENLSKKEATKVAKQYNDSHIDECNWIAKVVKD